MPPDVARYKLQIEIKTGNRWERQELEWINGSFKVNPRLDANFIGWNSCESTTKLSNLEMLLLFTGIYGSDSHLLLHFHASK